MASTAELESALLASEERCRALENGRELSMVTIDRIISALDLAGARDANLAALERIAPASPATDALAAKLEALIRAIASSLALGATEDQRRAHTAELATQTANVARVDDAHAEQFQLQHVHAQLEACEVSFENVRGVLCDCISQLDRPSSLSATVFRNGAQ